MRGVTIYEFLKQEPLSGGYHENRKFIFQVRDRLIDDIDDEVRTSMGLVEERRYIEQFERYVTQVSYWTKREKVPNPVTGRDEDPDEEFMTEIERLLDIGESGVKREDFRREVISKVGAWSLDHLGKKPDYEQIFPRPSPSCARPSSPIARSRSANQRGPAGLPGRRPHEDGGGRRGGVEEHADRAEDPLRLLRPLREGRGPGAGAQAVHVALERSHGLSPTLSTSWRGRRLALSGSSPLRGEEASSTLSGSSPLRGEEASSL